MNKLINKIFSLFPKHSAKIQDEKNKIRQQVRELKSQITVIQKQNYADTVFQKIESFPEFLSANTILIYWSTPGELPTKKMIEKWCSAKEILLPSVQGDDIIVKRYSSKNKMKQGNAGIWEPESADIFEGSVDLVIVPGVAFDLKKNRLGRGKGYYDRFLLNSKALKWGVGFDFQLLNSIPVSTNDVAMDKIITPTHTID